jgi:hypothetical protein
MFRRFAGLLLGLCVVGLAVPGAWAVAASPSNDNFANAQAISAGSVVPGTLVDASAEAGEPAHAGSAASNSVWYRWTAAETGRVGLRTCVGPATAVTRKAVYVGTSIDSLELVADDSYTPYCYMTFVADAGETYEIAIDARGPAGTFNLELNTYLPRPPNDDFADAEVIPSSTSPGPVAGTSYGATWEVGEPDLFFDLPAEASVWYRWTAPATGTVEIDNCSPSGDPVMAAYEGDQLEELDQLDANDDGCDYGSTINDIYVGSILVFDVVKGHQYRIAVDNLWENDTTDPLSHFTLYFGMDVEPPPSQGYLGSPPPPGFVTPPAVTPKKKRCKKHRGATSAKKRRCKKRKKH